jgi:glycosyltransferase involved in cell wall biosynthesis
MESSRALRTECGIETALSLPVHAEALAQSDGSIVEFPVTTYRNTFEFAARTLRVGRHIAPVVAGTKTLRPHIALNTMPAYWDFFFVRALRRMHIPFVTIVHDATVHPGDRFPLFDSMQRHVVRESAGIVTLSDFVASRLRERGWLGRLPHTTIPLPSFDFDEIDLPEPEAPEFGGDRPLRLLLVGRMKAYKGLHLFTEALQRLAPGKVQVRVAGTVEDRRQVDILRHKFNAELRLGWLSDAELFACMDWADVIVLPYVEASQSGVVPLAYKRARPVVATPVGGLPEQVRHGATGLLAKDASADAIADAIAALIETPALVRSCAEGALDLATGAWSWRQVAPRLAGFLQQVAEAASGHRES